ncbi:hypothetical protein ACFXPS_43620 [Nocardia sp. NPDC059091]|uniref:hypothetical protein n=1 Tax=unclassified Nocardia TaxID=2637762 RepID=UPI003691F2BE
MAYKLSRNVIRGAFGVVAMSAAVIGGADSASAAAVSVEPTAVPGAAFPIGLGNTGSSGTGSAGDGSIICWLLHPSPTCQI